MDINHALAPVGIWNHRFDRRLPVSTDDIAAHLVHIYGLGGGSADTFALVTATAQFTATLVANGYRVVVESPEGLCDLDGALI